MADIQPPEGGVINWILGGGALVTAIGIIKHFYAKLTANEEEDKQNWKAEKLDLKSQVAELTKKVEEMTKRIIELEKKDAANEQKIQFLEYELNKKANRSSINRRQPPA